MHATIGDENLHGAALRSHTDDVAQRRTGSARDDAHHPGQFRQRALSRRIEQALGFQLRAQFSKLGSEVTLAGELSGTGDELELPTRGVQRQGPTEPNPGSVFQRRLGAPNVRREHHPPQLRRVFLVVQREIHVPLRAPHVRELPFDQYVRPVVLECQANRSVDFGHAEDTFLAVMVLALKTLEQWHLRHACNLAAINPMKKGTVPFLLRWSR